MLKDLHTLSPYLDFIHACSADPDYRDPMLLTEQQLHRNLLDAPENPNTRVLGTFENDTVTGVFALLVQGLTDNVTNKQEIVKMVIAL